MLGCVRARTSPVDEVPTGGHQGFRHGIGIVGRRLCRQPLKLDRLIGHLLLGLQEMQLGLIPLTL